MNKKSIEAGQPEQVTVNEQKADVIPSAQVSANAVLAEVKKTNFTLDDVLRIISLTYNLSRKGEFVGDEWFYEYPYYDDVLEKLKSGDNFC